VVVADMQPLDAWYLRPQMCGVSHWTSAESDAARLSRCSVAADTLDRLLSLALHLDGQVLPNALGMLARRRTPTEAGLHAIPAPTL